MTSTTPSIDKEFEKSYFIAALLKVDSNREATIEKEDVFLKQTITLRNSLDTRPLDGIKLEELNCISKSGGATGSKITAKSGQGIVVLEIAQGTKKTSELKDPIHFVFSSVKTAPKYEINCSGTIVTTPATLSWTSPEISLKNDFVVSICQELKKPTANTKDGHRWKENIEIRNIDSIARTAPVLEIPHESSNISDSESARFREKMFVGEGVVRLEHDVKILFDQLPQKQVTSIRSLRTYVVTEKNSRNSSISRPLPIMVRKSVDPHPLEALCDTSAGSASVSTGVSPTGAQKNSRHISKSQDEKLRMLEFSNSDKECTAVSSTPPADGSEKEFTALSVTPTSAVGSSPEKQLKDLRKGTLFGGAMKAGMDTRTTTSSKEDEKIETKEAKAVTFTDVKCCSGNKFPLVGDEDALKAAKSTDPGSSPAAGHSSLSTARAATPRPPLFRSLSPAIDRSHRVLSDKQSPMTKTADSEETNEEEKSEKKLNAFQKLQPILRSVRIDRSKPIAKDKSVKSLKKSQSRFGKSNISQPSSAVPADSSQSEKSKKSSAAKKIDSSSTSLTGNSSSSALGKSFKPAVATIHGHTANGNLKIELTIAVRSRHPQLPANTKSIAVHGNKIFQNAE